MSDERVVVTGTAQAGKVMLECNECGPLGVSADLEVSKVEARSHMENAHGLTWVIQS